MSTETKTSVPKFEDKMKEIQTFWADATTENVERMASIYDQWAKLENKSVVQASNGVDEMAKLMKSSIDFMTSMSEQWRSLTLDTIRKAQR